MQNKFGDFDTLPLMCQVIYEYRQGSDHTTSAIVHQIFTQLLKKLKIVPNKRIPKKAIANEVVVFF